VSRLIPLVALLLIAALPKAGLGHDVPASTPANEFGIFAEHPAAISMLDLQFAGDEIEIGLRLQELTLREVPRWLLDTDLSGTISNFEFEQAWDRIAGMIEETLWLEFDGQVVHPEFEIAGYEGIGETQLDGSYHFNYVQLRAKIARPDSLETARIHSDLFLEDGNPKHTLMIAIEGLGADRMHTLLKGEDRDYDFEIPSALIVFGLFAELGWEHVLIGYDHLAFLVALMFGVACLADLLWAVTAFTLAHSVTLALSALHIFSLSPMVVEPGIAFSVLAVLAWHLRRGPSDARPWIPAFAFGLLHGFGFAGVLGEIGLPAGEQTMSLLGFNVGVELGQLTFVVPVVLMMAAVQRFTAPGTHRKVREIVALPAMAFAIFLVGNAALKFWLESFTGIPAHILVLVIGTVAAAIFCLLPCADAVRLRSLRRLTWQAALLLTFFSIGQQLRL
jgi:hypothetical protein